MVSKINKHVLINFWVIRAPSPWNNTQNIEKFVIPTKGHVDAEMGIKKGVSIRNG